MKTRIAFSLMLCLTALMVVLVMPSQGQIHGLLTFTLTEAASVRGVVLPPGTVTVEKLDLNGGNQVLVFRGSDGTTVSSVAEQISVGDAQTASGTQIVMRRTAKGLEIEKIWIAGQASGLRMLSAD